jgi:hypothetical protein
MGQTRRLCRVSYIGLTAAPRKHRDAGNVTNSQSDSAHFTQGPESDVHMNKTPGCVCRMPDRPSKSAPVRFAHHEPEAGMD